MKTKVVPVKPINDHLFDPELVKYEFRRKIGHRLSMMQNQRKSIRKRSNPLTLQGSKVKELYSKVRPAQKARIFNDEDVTVSDLLPYIDCAMKLQQEVSETATATNLAFRFQLLLIYLESFISFIFNCYYMISVIADPRAFKLPQGESMAYLSQHLIQPCICVVTTIGGFAMIQQKFEETQRVVNKIIIHAQDNEIRVRFSAFSQQIQSNIPVFTVYKFFSLDGSVLFSMISATTTYLIILVQTLGSESKVIPGLSTHFNKNNGSS